MADCIRRLNPSHVRDMWLPVALNVFNAPMSMPQPQASSDPLPQIWQKFRHCVQVRGGVRQPLHIIPTLLQGGCGYFCRVPTQLLGFSNGIVGLKAWFGVRWPTASRDGMPPEGWKDSVQKSWVRLHAHVVSEAANTERRLGQARPQDASVGACLDDRPMDDIFFARCRCQLRPVRGLHAWHGINADIPRS